MSAPRRRRGRRPSTTDWLQVLDVDGSFLAAPVVQDTWPDGLPALDQPRMTALRETSALLDATPGSRDAFVRHVLLDTLDWRHNLSWGPDAAALAVPVPEHATTVEVTFALRAQDDQGAVQDSPLLLGAVLPPRTPTTGRAPAGSGTWTAGPADRLAHALRVRKVPLGLVTNGNTWTLVTVSDAGAMSTATWTRHAWLEEPQTLRAFVALLTRTRFFGVPADATLPGLLTQSLARQEEVTERLAEQSQAVVEMLVATFGRLDAQHRAEHGERLLPDDVGPTEVYQAAVAVLMRLVFLLYAEERGLLPLDDDTYASAYAVNTLADALRDRATDHGEDALERTATGWYRLLALFRGVHRGARHEQLILPAYGGSLFDPDRFSWLEGRASVDQPLGSGAVPAIDDRTLLKALDSLQTLQFAKERRQVSYRSLDVEQIGYVYEGLLDQDARTADDWVVSIAVSDKDPRKNGPELRLADLEAKHAQGDDALAAWLVEQIKAVKGNRSKTSILKALAPLTGDEQRALQRLVRESCGNDDDVTARVMPFARLLRLDPRDLPVVYPPGSLYLTDSSARANTGAVYTPRFLAEQVVEKTLEAIVYAPGPLDTEDKSAWVLKTPEQILDLKICDIAAGSGAFLVAATRYLADRLLASRRQHAAARATAYEVADGFASEGASRSAVPGLHQVAKAQQDELDARRAIIANCIYGVDINPMAIEMAKLSLWITGLDRNRPFSFLDDHLVDGDSLIGITMPQQLRALHLDPTRGRTLHKDALDLFPSTVESDRKAASELRHQIALVGDRDLRDAETKSRLLRRATETTSRLTLVADGLVAAGLNGDSDKDYLVLAALVSAASSGDDPKDSDLRRWVAARLERNAGGSSQRAMHFPLIFPEVFSGDKSGFDAVVGNPPFLGAKKIKGVLGAAYRDHLVRSVARGRRGNADLIAYMLLRAVDLVDRDRGVVGLIGTNTLAQSDTREVGLDAVVTAGFDIRVAVKSAPWPTKAASLEYCVVAGSMRKARPGVQACLDGSPVPSILPSLDAARRVGGNPSRLAENRGLLYQGSNVVGMGFTLTAEDVGAMLAARASNADVLFPFLNGDDLNTRPDSTASRWIINFRDWPVAKAATYVEPFAWVVERVKPDRDRLPDYKKRVRDKYWQYEAQAKGLYTALRDLDRAFAIALTSSVVMPVVVDPRQVFSHALGVFASEDWALFAVLSSAPHYCWTLSRSSTLETRIRYTPSDSFETLPLPSFTERMRSAGEALHAVRTAFMLDREIGLTKTYRLVHSRASVEAEVVKIRDRHVDIDVAVCQAYGWPDLADRMRHDHYDTRQGVRWTVQPEVRSELLDRLLEENHRRYAHRMSTADAKPARSTSPRAGERGERTEWR